MYSFLQKIYYEIGETNNNCEILIKEIDKKIKVINLFDFLHVDDYVYYMKEDKFERGDRLSCNIGRCISISNLSDKFRKLHTNDLFLIFSLMILVVKSTNIIPTIWIVYNNENISNIMFDGSLKTTVLRNIDIVKEEIKKGDVKEIHFVSVYLLLDYFDGIEDLTTKDRQNLNSKQLINFIKIDRNLCENEYTFDGDKLKFDNYVTQVLKNERKTRIQIGREIILPIINAFKENKKESRKI